MLISQLDYSILHFLNSHHLPGSIPVMQFISDFTTWINISSVLIVLLAAWRSRSNMILKKFYILLAVLIISALLVYIMKNLINRERPFITYPNIEKMSSGGDASFPSGHTMETFALATAFFFLFRKRKIILSGFGWALLVAYTRLALGVHYPSDVLAGAIFGFLTGTVLSLYGEKLLKSDPKQTDYQRSS